MHNRRAWSPLLFAVSFLFVADPRTAFAQTPYSCTVNAAAPLGLRPQGLTERVGDIFVSCAGTAPLGGVVGTVTVFLNTTVTSRLLSGSVSEALLLVDEPAPGSQTLGVNLFEGTVAANSVTFTGVPLAPAPGGDVTRSLRIVNIRADAAALGPGASVPASLSLPLPTQNPVVGVGQVQSPVAFSVTPRSFTLCAEPQPFNVHFAETNPNDLKLQGGTGQSTPGAIYTTETGFTPQPVIAGVGTADSGTQLFATFTGVPAGVDLSVPASVTNGSLTITAVDPPGGGLVSVAGGTATIVYEVTATNIVALESVNIPVTISYSSPDPNLVAAVQVQGGLAPISTVATASSSAPIPRFEDQSTASPAFSISPCIVQVPTLNLEAMAVFVLALLSLGILVLRRS